MTAATSSDLDVTLMRLFGLFQQSSSRNCSHQEPCFHWSKCQIVFNLIKMFGFVLIVHQHIILPHHYKNSSERKILPISAQWSCCATIFWPNQWRISVSAVFCVLKLAVDSTSWQMVMLCLTFLPQPNNGWSYLVAWQQRETSCSPLHL